MYIYIYKYIHVYIYTHICEASPCIYTGQNAYIYKDSPCIYTGKNASGVARFAETQPTLHLTHTPSSKIQNQSAINFSKTQNPSIADWYKTQNQNTADWYKTQNQNTADWYKTQNQSILADWSNISANRPLLHSLIKSDRANASSMGALLSREILAGNLSEGGNMARAVIESGNNGGEMVEFVFTDVLVVRLYVCVHACMCVRMCACMYVCAYVCMCVCVYACIVIMRGKWIILF